MKKFLFLLAFGLAAADKLDRTYLPPPGSKYAGGHPGDLQVPLEFPKESYTTTSPFTSGQINDGSVTIGDGLIPGPTRLPGTVNPENFKDLVPGTPIDRSPFTNFQNSFKVPSTTTSYAFTQTTTFPTTESFETTPSPTGSGFPIIDGSLNQQPGFVNEPLGNGQIFNQHTGQFNPGFTQPENQITQGLGSSQGLSIPEVQNPFPGNQITSGLPGFNRYQQDLLVPTFSPNSGTSFQPGFVTIPNQGNTQHQGLQPPQQFVPQGIYQSTTASPGPGYQYNVPSQNIQGTGVTGQQQPDSPPTSPQQSQTQLIDKYGNIQSKIPSYTIYQRDQQYGGDLNSNPGISGLFTQQGVQQTVNGFVPGQQQDISGQKAIYSPEQYQLTNVPRLPGNVQQKQFGGLQPYLPGQRNQRPQYQQTFPTSSIPQGTATPVVSRDQTQQPQLSGQQTNYPSTINPQGFITDTITQQQLGGQQPQYIGQQQFPSTLTPQGQVINQGNQPTGQQNVFPSTDIPQPFTTFGQNGSEFNGNQHQATGQSFPMPSNDQPGFYRPGENQIYVNGSNVSGYNAIPNDGRVSSQPSIAQKSQDQNLIPDGPQNIHGSSTTKPISSLPSNYLQPSTIASYSTTPESIYSSSTTSYPGARIPANPSINARPLPERPQAESDRNAAILNYENVLTPEGYAYNFDTSNGIHADENGTTVDGTKANGSYSYIGDDGKFYRVEYTADENGFRPHGDHLPTPPPIPEAIQKVIEQANKDKEAGISHDGFYDDAKYGHKKYKSHKNQHPEKQDQFRNGAEISDDYDNGYENKVKMPRRKGERKPVTSTNNNYPTEYEDGGYDSEDDTDKNIRLRPSKTSLSKQTNYIKNESVKSENEDNKDLVTTIEDQKLGYPTRQQMQQRKPFGQDSVRRRPSSPSLNRKPGSSKVKNNNEETNDSGVIAEGSEEFKRKPNQVFYENDRRAPLKFAEIESSRRMKLPGRFNYEKKTDNEEVKGESHHGSPNSQQDNNSYELEQARSKDKNKPIKPSKTFDGNYYNTDESSEDQEDYKTPSFSDEYQYVTNQPNGLQKMGSKTNNYESTRNQRPGDDLGNIDSHQKSSEFKPKGQPSNDQSTNRKYYNKSDDEESGYHYIPPQNKLDQEEKSRFPSRFSEKATKKPLVTKYIEDKKTTAQPFITPNVHRDEDDIYEDVSEENTAPRRPIELPSKEKDSGNFVTSTTLKYEDETTDVSTEYSDETNRPEKERSTRRPEYSSQKTTDKQEYDEYSKDDQELGPQSVFKMPNQGNHDSYSEDSSNELPQSARPGQKPGASKKPTYSYTSSTTQMPFRKSNRPGFKSPFQQRTDQVQSTASYEPTDISSNEDEYTRSTTKPSNYTTKPNDRRPISKPMIKDESDTTRISSSRLKSQPTLDYTDDLAVSVSPMIRPGISEIVFNRPSTRPSSSKRPAYSTSRPVAKSNRPDARIPNRTATINKGYYDKTKPGYGTFSSTTETPTETPDRLTSGPITGRPEPFQSFDQPGSQFLPSTTYRPNYYITDIFEPGSVTVDAFGKTLQPVPGTRQPVSQSGPPGITPNYPISTSIGTPTGQNIINEDSRVTIPGQQGSRFNSFKPTEPRFGGPVQVTPGTKPAEFGPSSVTTPGYLSPYGFPTEKVIGEVFSGPKQQQKFDPETGYYY